MNRRIRNWASQLGTALKRLEASEGRRTARNNAREEVQRLTSRIRRELFKEFPNFTKDGKPVIHEIPLPDGQKSCPLCGSYAGTYVKLADHILDHHAPKCPCGYVPAGIKNMPIESRERLRAEKGFSNWGGRQMAGHLRGVQEDLKTHLLVGAIGSQSSSPPALSFQTMINRVARKTKAV